MLSPNDVEVRSGPLRRRPTSRESSTRGRAAGTMRRQHLGHPRLRVYDRRQAAATAWVQAGLPSLRGRATPRQPREAQGEAYGVGTRGDDQLANDHIDAFFGNGRALQKATHPRVVDPRREFVRVEAKQVAPLDERDSALGNESANMSDAHAQVVGHVIDVEQPSRITASTNTGGLQFNRSPRRCFIGWAGCARGVEAGAHPSAGFVLDALVPWSASGEEPAGPVQDRPSICGAAVHGAQRPA